MSECRFFWTNFHKSVELEPVCPSVGPTGRSLYVFDATTRGLYLYSSSDGLGWQVSDPAVVPDNGIEVHSGSANNDRVIPTATGCWVQVRAPAGSGLGSAISFFATDQALQTTYVASADDLILGRIGDVCVLGMADKRGVTLLHPDGGVFEALTILPTGLSSFSGMKATCCDDTTAIVEYGENLVRVDASGAVLASAGGFVFGYNLARAGLPSPATMFAIKYDATPQQLYKTNASLGLEIVASHAAMEADTLQVESGTSSSYVDSLAEDLVLYERVPVRPVSKSVPSAGVTAINAIRTSTGDLNPRGGVLSNTHVWVNAIDSATGNWALHIVNVDTGDTTAVATPSTALPRAVGSGVLVWDQTDGLGNRVAYAYDIVAKQVSEVGPLYGSPNLHALAPRPLPPT